MKLAILIAAISCVHPGKSKAPNKADVAKVDAKEACERSCRHAKPTWDGKVCTCPPVHPAK